MALNAKFLNRLDRGNMNPIIPNQMYINPDGDDDGKSIDKTMAAFLRCYCPEIFDNDKLDGGDGKDVRL